jgi:hypothetical protein
MAFPSLTVTNTPAPGAPITFSFNNTMHDGATLYAAFFSGLNTRFAELDSSMSTTVPDELIGTVYVVISTNGTSVSDDNTVAGPAILEFRLPEDARQTSGY